MRRNGDEKWEMGSKKGKRQNGNPIKPNERRI